MVAIIVVVIWSFAGSRGLLDDPDAVQDGAVGAVAYSLGAAFGSSFFIAGIVWLVLFFGFTRRLAPNKAGGQFGILLAAAVLGAAPVGVLNATAAGRQEGFRAFEEVMARGDARRKGLTADTVAARDRVVAGGFMEAEALAEPGGLARARDKLAKLRALSERAKIDAQDLATDIRTEFGRLPVSEARREQILTDYNAGVAKGLAEAEEDIRLTNAAFDAIDGQLDVLERKPRAWVLQDGQLAFSRDADLAEFNRHAETLATVTERGEARRRERAAARQPNS